MSNKLALDASMRSIDENGHLLVKRTVISMAGVNPYFGREIPNFAALGLEPDKIYHLLRCPDELLKGADSFKLKQLLIRHLPVDADDVKKEYTIGSVGSDIVFDNPKLYSDIAVWDGAAIDLIESEKMKELSAGYSYTADMTPGEYEGVRYDGVMRDICGNHVALVTRGRIGRDAIISDSMPLELELNMKLKKGAMKRIAAKMKTLAQDESGAEELVREVAENIEHKPAFDFEELKAIVGDDDKFEKIVELVGGRAGDEAPKNPEDGAPKPAGDEQAQAERDNESEAMRLKDREERESKDRKRDQAMDADAIAAAAAKAAKGEVMALYQARDAVAPLVGNLALDGFTDAAEVYAYALKQKGIACDGVNEAGMKQLVMMASSNANRPMALDADPSPAISKFTERFNQA